MKLKQYSSKRGITLLGLLVSILILGMLGTFLGKMLFFVIKSKNRMEAKTSVIDNESTLVNLIASRMKSMLLTKPQL
ncbi:MAG: type II secretion system protein [Pseudomonadota bacterium]